MREERPNGQKNSGLKARCLTVAVEAEWPILAWGTAASFTVQLKLHQTSEFAVTGAVSDATNRMNKK